MKINSKLLYACDHLLKPWSKKYSSKEKAISWIATLTFGVLSAGLVQGGSLILKCLLKKNPKLLTPKSAVKSKANFFKPDYAGKLWGANYRVNFYKKQLAECEEKIAKIEEQLTAKYILIRDLEDPLIKEQKKLEDQKYDLILQIASDEADVKFFESQLNPVKGPSSSTAKS